MFFHLLDWHWHKLLLNHLGFPTPNLKTLLGAQGQADPVWLWLMIEEATWFLTNQFCFTKQHSFPTPYQGSVGIWAQ
jgi:hypothetical protein